MEWKTARYRAEFCSVVATADRALALPEEAEGVKKSLLRQTVPRTLSDKAKNIDDISELIETRR